MTRNTTASLLIFALSALTLGLFAMKNFGGHFSFTSDDLTLYNPVHTYVTSGKLNYPVYEGNHVITVHPPFQYWLVGTLVKLGFNTQQAYTIPFLSALLILLTVLNLSPAGFLLKLSIILSLQFLFLFPTATIRPDYVLALLWISGIILLEWGRIYKEKFLLLFWGSLVVSIGSLWHYYGFFSLTVLVVPFANQFRSKSESSNYKNIQALLLGVLLIYIPYFLLYLVPNWESISGHIQSNQGTGGMADAVHRHWEYYTQFAAYFDEIYFLSPSVLGYYLATTYKIPLFFLAFSIMICFRSTRQIALMSLWFTAFIFLFSRGKSEGYFIPEILLFAISTNWLVLWFAVRWWDKASTMMKIGLFMMSLWISFTFLIGPALSVSNLNFPWHAQRHDMHIVRACSKKIVGENAKLSGRVSAWYISGATQWHDLSPDILRTGPLPNRDSLKRYFGQFDAIAETRHMSNYTTNDAQSTINTMYIDSLLFLRGLVFSENGGYESELACVFYTSRNEREFIAYIHKVNDGISIVSLDSTGDMLFLSAIVPRSEGLLDTVYSKLQTLECLNYFPLPKQTGGGKDYRYRDVDHDIVFTIIARENYLKNLAFINHHFTILDTFICKIAPYNITPTLSEDTVAIRYY